MDRPISIPEAAEYIGVGERMMRRLVQERRIPFVRYDKKLIRLLPRDLDHYLQANRVEAES